MSVKRRLILSAAATLLIPAVLIVFLSILLVVVFALIKPEARISFSDGIALSDPFVFKLVMIWCIGSVIIVGITAVVVAINIYKNVILPIKRLSKGVEYMKKGDLSYEFIGSGDAELRELFASFEELRLRLQRNVKQELENDDLRQQLLVNLSHDIKTPVTSIKGYVEGILDGVAATDEMRERYMNTIYSKADLIERLADNLSVYSKLEMGKMQYSMTDIDITDFVPKTVSEYEIDLNIAGIDINYDISPKPLICVGDKENLRRVFTNIITNAIKYKAQGKGCLDISIKSDKAGIRINFADRGRGIPKEDLERIFDGFFRADLSRNSAIPGNGLGLSVCKRIIEDHGGRIWARNRDGGGTEFIMIIPEVNK